jgi:hypothetical protein
MLVVDGGADVSQMPYRSFPAPTTNLAERLARQFSKRSLGHAARVMALTLVALAFVGVAHGQGTMDFSGAQTLMGTFKTTAETVSSCKSPQEDFESCINPALDILWGWSRSQS